MADMDDFRQEFEKKWTVQQWKIAAGTMGVFSLVDLFSYLGPSHLGPGGLVAGLIAAAVAGDQGEKMASGVRDALPAFLIRKIENRFSQNARAKVGAHLEATHYQNQPKTGSESREDDLVSENQNSYGESGGVCDAGPEDEILDLGSVMESQLPFKIHANRTFGEGLFVAGNQGSGKSVLLARLVEQFCNCRVTCIVFDLKPDFYTIPAKYTTAINAGHPDYASQFGGGYYSVTADNADQFVADVMTAGNQVIVNLPSYEEPDAQGEIIAAIIEALMRWGKELDEQYRFPCYVFLDEAHNFLPQQTDVAPISKEIAEIVNRAFFKICNQGRAYGYTMAFFTQRIANIKKWVIANCQIKVIMKHGLDVDLRRCEEEINKRFATREDIEKLGKGQGIVIGWGMQPFFVQFKMRESHHPSSTPDIKRARAFHANGGSQTATATRKQQATQDKEPTLDDVIRLVRQHPEIDPMQFVGQMPDYRETDDLPEPTMSTRSPYYEQVGQQYYQSSYHTEPDLSERRVQRHEQATITRAPQRYPKYQKALQAWSDGHRTVRDLAAALGIPESAAYTMMKEMDQLGLIQMKKRKQR